MRVREILELIHDKIGPVKIDHSGSVESAMEELGKNQFLIISGGPGSGKSAMAKHIIEKQPGCIIALRADELAEGNLNYNCDMRDAFTDLFCKSNYFRR